MGRPKNPNSQRSLMEKRREAEQKAKLEAERVAKYEAELKEHEAKAREMESKLAELEAEKAELEADKAQELDQLKAELEAAKEAQLHQHYEDHSATEEIAEDSISQEDMELLSILNDAVTKEKNPQSEIPENTEIQFAASDFEGDFEPEPDAPEIIRESEIPGKVFAGIPPKEFADFLVNGFDGLLQWAAPMSYKKMAFSKEDLKRLREIQQQAKVKSKKELVLDDEDYDLMGRMEEFLEYKDTIPLSDKEKKSLRLPLEIMLQEKGGDIPPGWALVYAATTIAIPRFSPHAAIMLAKQFSKYQSPLNNDSNESESNSNDA
jgi:hypothetical protein